MTLTSPRITEMSRCLIRGLAKDALMEDNHEDLLERESELFEGTVLVFEAITLEWEERGLLATYWVSTCHR